MKTPFKLLPNYDDQGAIRFEAVFDLPNDGVSTNQLVFLVCMESADAQKCDIDIIGRTSKDTPLGSFQTATRNLGNVLYGFARIETRAFLNIGGRHE